MSKDITEEILLKAGFKYFEEDSDNTSYYSYSPDENEKGDWSIILTYSKNNDRDWHCEVSTSPTTYADADIQTVEHFNKLMEIMGINFKLKEE